MEETAALIYTCYPNAAISIVPWLLKSIPRHEIRFWTLEKVWPTLIRFTRYKSEVDLMEPTSANQRIKSPGMYQHSKATHTLHGSIEF